MCNINWTQFRLDLTLSFCCLDCKPDYDPDLSRLMTKPINVAVRPAMTQISLGIRPVWSESSICAQWVAKSQSFLHADSEDSDQTGRMPRLIWVFARRTCHFVRFIMRPLIFCLNSETGTSFFKTCISKWAALWQNQQSGVCAQRRLRSAWASTQSDQSLRCLHEKVWVLSYQLSAQRRRWADCADAQADLSLRWAHSHFVGLSFFFFFFFSLLHAVWYHVVNFYETLYLYFAQ